MSSAEAAPTADEARAVASGAFGRREWAIWFGATLVLTIGIVLELRDWPGLQLSVRSGTDMHAYLVNAEGLIRGTWPAGEQIYRAPLYSGVLAILVLLFDGELVGMLIGQCVLMAAAVAMTADTAARFLGRRAGHVAGALFVGYAGVLYWSAVLHSTATEVFCCALAIWTLARFVGRPSFAEAAAFGFSGALLCLIRPNFMLIGPLLVIGLAVQFGRGDEGRKNFQRLGVAVLAFSLPIAALSVRNSLILGRLSSFSTNGKITYENSNRTDSPIYNFGYTKGELLRPAQAAFWRHQGRKAIAYWRSWEYPQNVNFYHFREHSYILRWLPLNHAILSALGIWGSILAVRRRRDLWPHLVMFWGYYLTVVAFFVIGRFRVTALPSLVVLGAFAVDGLIAQVRERQARRWVPLVLGLAAAVVVMRPWERADRVEDRQRAFEMAVRARDLAAAAAELELWRAHPGYDVTPEQRERMAPALAAMAASVAVLGRADSGRQGIAELEKLYAARPGNARIAATLASAHRYLGEEEKARAVEREIEARGVGRPDVDYFKSILQTYEAGKK